jgi:hypothetical protein
MRRRILLLAAALTTSITLHAAPAWAQYTPARPQLSEAAWNEVRNGDVWLQVTVNGQVIEGDVVAVIRADAARVWAAVSDFAGQDRWVPDLEDARIVSTQGNIQVGAATTRLSWPLSNRTWQVRIHNRAQTVGGVEGWVSTWEYIEGSGNMLDQSGYWLVQPWQEDPTATLVRYRFRANAGISAPDGIERSVTRRMLPNVIRGLRQHLGAG